MKFLLLASAIFASSNSAMACSPAPYPYIYQTSQLDFILNSQKLSAELSRLGGARIESIEMKDAGYKFNLSSNCFVKAKVVYKNPENGGLCPRMVDVTIDSGCL